MIRMYEELNLGCDLSEEVIFDYIQEHGSFTSAGGKSLELADKLSKDELILKCSEIEHHPQMLNPSYTFVSNDERGRKLAKEVPLYTKILRVGG